MRAPGGNQQPVSATNQHVASRRAVRSRSSNDQASAVLSSSIRSARQQGLDGTALSAVLRAHSVNRIRTCVEAHACVLAAGVQNVEDDVEIGVSATVQESAFGRRRLYAPQRLHGG